VRRVGEHGERVEDEASDHFHDEERRVGGQCDQEGTSSSVDT
jgi:hypothetical protein